MIFHILLNILVNFVSLSTEIKSRSAPFNNKHGQCYNAGVLVLGNCVHSLFYSRPTSSFSFSNVSALGKPNRQAGTYCWQKKQVGHTNVSYNPTEMDQLIRGLRQPQASDSSLCDFIDRC